MLIVFCPTQVMEEPDTESKEAVSESGASVSGADSEQIHRDSHRLLGDEKEETTGEEIKHKDTEAGSEAPSPSSAEDTVTKVLVQGDEPDSFSDSEKEAAVVKTEEEFELIDEKVGEKYNTMEESSVKVDAETGAEKDKTKEDVDTQEDERPHSSNLRVSNVDDLDEMMDIGTVDQVEQEAQMKEEEGNSLDEDIKCSGEEWKNV